MAKPKAFSFQVFCFHADYLGTCEGCFCARGQVLVTRVNWGSLFCGLPDDLHGDLEGWLNSEPKTQHEGLSK